MIAPILLLDMLGGGGGPPPPGAPPPVLREKRFLVRVESTVKETIETSSPVARVELRSAP